jgi:pimeloyl-ACP methyl ester carboxylesterase
MRKLSIDFKERVEINGVLQTIHVWGEDVNNPIILFLHGGPGNPFRHKIAANFLPLCDHYTLAAYDERGSGASYSKKLTPRDLTVDKYVDDVIAWARWLLEGTSQTQIYLVGESFGSFIGTRALLKEPSLFKAYIGYGQFVGVDPSLRWQYETLEHVLQERGEDEKLDLLHQIGRPGEPKFQTRESRGIFLSLLHPTLEPEWFEPYKVREVKPFRRSKEYTWREKRLWKKGANLSSFAFSNWSKADRNLPSGTLNFPMPYYVIQGSEDYITPYPIAKDYLENRVKAKKKAFITYEGYCHICAMENPVEFMKDIRRLFKD